MKTPAPASGFTEAVACRVCGSSALETVMDLGLQAIAGVFPARGSGPPPMYPLELVRCTPDGHGEACGLLQLRHSVSSSLLYDSYWYRSGINRTMTQNLHEIAGQAVEIRGGLQAGDLVLDIGCNDGTLLDGYRAKAPPGVRFLGIDPSDVTRYALEKGYEVVHDLFTRRTFEGAAHGQKAALITSVAMFYDLESPTEFTQDIASCLADDGIWVSEFSYMPTMLDRNSFDTICHEHLEYYSMSVVERVFAAGGLRILHAELNDINGGSIRLFATHAGNTGRAQSEGVDALRARERDMALDTSTPYVQFRERSEHVRDTLLRVLTDIRSAGHTIHIYGASTKGNTTLQYCGIDNSLVDVAADRNPDKWGLETIATGIPIVSEEESRNVHPDYYLVLPWHFLDEMLEREEAFLLRGGKFIVPLPEVRTLPSPS